MTDLIKQLQYLSRVTKDYDQEHMTSADYEMIPAVTKLAADRIEELKRERDEWRTDSAAAWDKCVERRIAQDEAEAKLAKAMDALRSYTKTSVGFLAKEVLAELDGNND